MEKRSMSEAVRIRPVEHHSPRGLILGICFVWGVGVGFAINFFRGTETIKQPEPAGTEQTASTERTGPTELERRRQDIPNLAEVSPTPSQTPSSRPTIEEVMVGPPAAVLTTEGGLTGRTAAPLGTGRRVSPPAMRPGAGAPSAAPPPIPDLSP